MKKGQIITMWVAIILIAVIGTFFLAPLISWKEMDENEKYLNTGRKILYWVYCLNWWKVKYLESIHKEDTVTYTGGTLDEITVTPNKK